MKPVFLLIASFPDSLIKFRGPLIDSILAKGFDVHVAVPDLLEVDAVYRELIVKGVVVHSVSLQRTGINPISDLGALWAIYKVVKKVRPNLILGYTIKPVIYGGVATWLARVPRRFALITGLGYAFTGQVKGKRRLLKFLVQRLYWFSLSRMNKVFFQNPDDECLFRQIGILPNHIPSCVVNGSGIDLTEYCKAPLPEKISFLLIARLLGDKGVREYAQAAVKVKSKYPNSRFQLVGWIDDNPDAIRQDELDKWVEDGALEYLGKLSDVRPAISDCSVYVLPSYREGTPRTVLEAMAMGRAVITTDSPGCRETVAQGDNGYLVPVKAVSELAEVMTRFIETPKLAEQMGRRSRELAEQKYDVNKVNERMLKEMEIVQ